MKFDLQLVDRRARSVRTIRPLFNRLGLLWTIELPETGVEVELDLNGSERIMDGNVSRAKRRLRGSNAGRPFTEAGMAGYGAKLSFSIRAKSCRLAHRL